LDADPDLIFLACTKYCGETAESVAARPGWEGLAAVTTGRVLEMDDDIASRWGPRIVDYYRIVAASVTELSTELATAGATDSDGGRGY
jgi:iron complex transport system substrate-binding protein